MEAGSVMEQSFPTRLHDTKEQSSFNQPTLWLVLVTLSGPRPSHTFEDCQRNMTFCHNSVRLYLMVPGEI